MYLYVYTHIYYKKVNFYDIYIFTSRKVLHQTKKVKKVKKLKKLKKLKKVLTIILLFDILKSLK